MEHAPLRAPKREFAHDQSAGKYVVRQRRSSRISKRGSRADCLRIPRDPKIRSQALQNRPAFFILNRQGYLAFSKVIGLVGLESVN